MFRVYGNCPKRPKEIYARVKRTPFDLLISILKLAISKESEFSPAYDLRALHIVNTVCRHWRWTALNAPSLWSYIPSCLPSRLVQIFVKRSGDNLLHVDLTCNDYFHDFRVPRMEGSNLLRKLDEILAKLAIVLRHSNRIRYVSLSLPPFALTVIDSEMAARGMHCRTPVLEGLRFKDNTDLTWERPREECFMDAALLLFKKFRSPTLRELHIDGVMISRDCIPVISLSRLSLKVVGTEMVAKEYLIHLLKGGASLVRLSLDVWSLGVGLGHDGSTSTTANFIPLPELRQLTLKGPFDQCVLTYRMLSAPSLEEIKLETRYPNFEDGPLFIPSRPPGDLVRIFLGDDTVRIEFADSGRLCRGVGGSFLFTISTPYKFGIGNFNHIFPALLNSHHFTEVTFVDVSISHPFDHALLPSLLPHFGTLHSLRIHFADDSREVFNIEEAIDLSLLCSPSSPLRALQHLVFRNFAVTMPHASPFLIGLCVVVQERDRSGLPPLVPEFFCCQGVTDSLLRACGLNAS